MGLLNLPTSDSIRESSKKVASRTSNKKPASTIVRGTDVLSIITAINSRVEEHLGKYKDDYAVLTDDNFLDYIDCCLRNGICAIDTETTGLNPLKDHIVGMSIYTPDKKAVYIPIHHISYMTGLESEGQVSTDIIAKGMQLLLDNECKIIMHNAQFDIRVIEQATGVRLHCYFDTQIAACCLNENESHKLKLLYPKYVLNGAEDGWTFDKLFEGITFDKVPIQTGYIYGARDSYITYKLYEWQLPYLTISNELCIEYDLRNVAYVFWNIEMPYVDVIVELENNGVRIDKEYAKVLSEKYNTLKEDKLNEIYSELENYSDEILDYKLKNPNHKLSEPINIDSPKQLATLFYDVLKVPVVDEKNPRGTGEEILSKIDNPLCKLILDYRGIAKLVNTYIDALPELVHTDGRVHCNFKQYGAKTGRLSSDEPNLQNIPSHNKDIRPMFVASEGYVMLSSDFSQQEPRCMAAMCGDETMLQAYRDDKDLYASIAALAFNTTYEECLEYETDADGNFILDKNGEKITYKEGKERRASAKSILLGILYGRGINSVAEQLNVSKQKAQMIQDKVFKGFPAIKQFEDDTLDMAEQLGFVTTFWGRKRRLPEMQLPEYEFSWMPGYGDTDPLSFDNSTIETSVPEDLVVKYEKKLRKAWGNQKKQIFEEAKKEGIHIVDNGGKIADATRQCVNSRIQGSAADMSKIAGRIIYDNQRLRDLGFRLLIPIHDEYLAECPKENAKECAKLFSECMCMAAKDLGIPIKCDVEITEKWYGERVEL